MAARKSNSSPRKSAGKQFIPAKDQEYGADWGLEDVEVDVNEIACTLASAIGLMRDAVQQGQQDNTHLVHACELILDAAHEKAQTLASALVAMQARARREEASA